MRTSIVCFGDSNTYGYNPENGGRYDENIRWPKVLAKLLGEDFEIFEEGQNGRTIANADHLHLDPEGHDKLARMVKDKIEEMM